MMREKRRKKARWKMILITILSLILVITVSALIVVKVFVVKNVKVQGNVLYDEALIKSTVLNDDYSWNSLYVFLKYTFLETEELPFIDTMEIKLENPNTLSIKVYEKGMMGYLYIPAIGENAYFDKDGFVVETSTRVIKDVPRIEGLQCTEVVLYEQLPTDSKLLKQMLTLTQALKREELDPEIIRYGVANEPVLVYGSIEVALGSTEFLTQKVERIKKILPELKDMSGTLHLENWTESTTNIVFDKTE